MSDVKLKFTVLCDVVTAPGLDGEKERALRLSVKWPDTQTTYIDMLLQGQVDKDDHDKREEDERYGKNKSGTSGSRWLGWDTEDVAEALQEAIDAITRATREEYYMGVWGPERSIPPNHRGDISVTHDGKGPGKTTGTVLIKGAEHIDVACSYPKLKIEVAAVIASKDPATPPPTKVPALPVYPGVPPFVPVNGNKVPFVNGRLRPRNPERRPGPLKEIPKIKFSPVPLMRQKSRIAALSSPFIGSSSGAGAFLVVTPLPAGMEEYTEAYHSKVAAPGLGRIRLRFAMLRLGRQVVNDSPGSDVDVFFEYSTRSPRHQSDLIFYALATNGVLVAHKGEGLLIMGLNGRDASLASVDVLLGVNHPSTLHHFPWSLVLESRGLGAMGSHSSVAPFSVARQGIQANVENVRITGDLA